MNVRPTSALFARLLIMIVLSPDTTAEAADEAPPPGLKPVGGRWYVREGKEPVYYYKDGHRYADLFSYHAKDSNEDGVANVRVRHEGGALVVDSQGYPNHPTAVFPNSRNPNTIRVQDFHFKFPLVPRKAETVTRVPMGPIGMALNGVVFFNPFEAGGMNAIEGYSEVWLDSCCGHPQQHGVYHYHKYPSCVKTPFPDDGKGHSPVLGFAFDGYPLHGPFESAGVMAKDVAGASALDVCNGHEDAARGYHYHVTPGRFPYLLGGYAGVVEASNNRGLGRGGAGGAIVNNASGVSREGGAVRSVTPGTVGRGKTHVIRIVMDPKSVPGGAPSWVQFGPFEATNVERDGDVVTARIAVPADAPLGVLLDGHLEFAPSGGGRPRVFKKNEVLRVVE